MVVLDADLATTDLTPVEVDGGIRFSPALGPGHEPCDLLTLYERERARADREQARADAAEVRCDELRRAEVVTRSDAGAWKSRFGKCRDKLTAVEEETKKLRRTVQAALSLQPELERLDALFCEADAEIGGHVKVGSVRMMIGQVCAAMQAVEAGRRRPAPRLSQHLDGRVATLEQENRKLRKALEAAEGHKETIRWQNREIVRHVAELRRLRDQNETVRSLSAETYRLGTALGSSEHEKEKLKRRIVKLRAVGATLSKLPFDEAVHLRNVLRRSRRQKAAIRFLTRENARLRKAVKAAKTGRASAEERLAGLRTVRKTLSTKLAGLDAELRKVLRRSRRQKSTIKTLSRENARLRRTVKGLRNRIEALEAETARLRATGKVLSRRLYGRKSEQQKKPRSERKRGQQRGAPGHGRTRRPGLEERPEVLALPPEACACAQCGQPYAPNGVEESTLVEIEVKAHKRVIQRPRMRRTCECASSPMEVSAPPVARLFRGTPYGITFWARFLFELSVGLRPLSRTAAWMSAQGLAVSPGTLADSLKRFVPLFEAILAHQNEAAVRHADETSWRVQELRGEDRSNRAWLWTSVSHDAVCFHIDPSRSAEAALKLFAEALPHTIVVCDRYSAYKRLVRLLGGKLILAFCWSHVRRDYIEAAAGQERLTQWCQEWIERIAEIFRLNDARLEHYKPGRKRQTAAFRKATRKLKKALDRLFAHAEAELAALPEHAREGKALRSLLNHREGLCVFVDHPQVPLTNNVAERILRGPAIGRGLSFGSNSEDGAEFTAIMYSVVGTLSMNGIDVLRWLEAWLAACAENGRQPPDDLSAWLPWSMSEERRLKFTAQE